MNGNSDDELIKAVAESISIAGVLRSLGRAVVGTNYRLVHREVARLGLDTSHWRGKAHGTTVSSRRLGREDLVGNSDLPTGYIKKIVLREGLIPYLCVICGCTPEWNGKPLVLRLDHKDGVRNNHSLENLRFLCPNCDSQTPTFCGRNKAPRTLVRSVRPKFVQQTKIAWPSVEELISQVKAASYSQVAKRLGVSDNAIRKHLRSRPLVVEGGRL